MITIGSGRAMSSRSFRAFVTSTLLFRWGPRPPEWGRRPRRARHLSRALYARWAKRPTARHVLELCPAEMATERATLIIIRACWLCEGRARPPPEFCRCFPAYACARPFAPDLHRVEHRT